MDGVNVSVCRCLQSRNGDQGMPASSSSLTFLCSRRRRERERERRESFSFSTRTHAVLCLENSYPSYAATTTTTTAVCVYICMNREQCVPSVVAIVSLLLLEDRHCISALLPLLCLSRHWPKELCGCVVLVCSFLSFSPFGRIRAKTSEYIVMMAMQRQKERLKQTLSPFAHPVSDCRLGSCSEA